MSERFFRILVALLFFVCIGLISYLLVLFHGLDGQFKAVIIGALIAITGSVFSVTIGRVLERRNELEYKIRDKKYDIYREVIIFFHDLMSGEKLGKEPLSDDEMLERIIDINSRILLWASAGVFEKWSALQNFLKVQGDLAGKSPEQWMPGVIDLMTGLFSEIRRDLGHRQIENEKMLMAGLIFAPDVIELISKNDPQD